MKAKSKISIVVIFIILMTGKIVSAQKLPNIQKAGVWAPKDVKIDGFVAEWQNEFSAYNKATDIFYTLSNDDKNIYLVVQAKYREVIDKILRSGITLSLNHKLSKKDDRALSVTYPSLDPTDKALLANMFARKVNQKTDNKDGDISIDDLQKVFNEKSKLIKVDGVDSLHNEELSVYNEKQISVASKFDGQLAYTCELAIPLKYLALPKNGEEPFSYHIKINSRTDSVRPQGSGPPAPPMSMEATVATDFWGEYQLVKKSQPLK